MSPLRRTRLLVALMASAALVACGQKGPLTLPQGAAPPAQPPQTSADPSDDEESEDE